MKAPLSKINTFIFPAAFVRRNSSKEYLRKACCYTGATAAYNYHILSRKAPDKWFQRDAEMGHGALHPFSQHSFLPGHGVPKGLAFILKIQIPGVTSRCSGSLLCLIVRSGAGFFKTAAAAGSLSIWLFLARKLYLEVAL